MATPGTPTISNWTDSTVRGGRDDTPASDIAWGQVRYRLGAAALAFLALSMMLRAAAQARVADLDMFHQMALFRAALELGRMPEEDLFAFTSTVTPSVHHEWGAGAVLYLLVVSLGLGEWGVIALKYSLLSLLAGASYLCARMRGASGAAMILCAPVAILMLGVGMSSIRAHTYTFAILAVLLVLLEIDKAGARWWIAAWLPLYVVWLNLHGGFVVGLGLFGIYVVERVWAGREDGVAAVLRRSGHLIATLAAMILLVAANPYGLAYVPYLWEALVLDRPLIAEWAPFWDPRVAPFLRFAFFASLPLLLYAVVKLKGRGLPQIAMLAVAFLGALSAQRVFPIYGIVWFCFVSGYLSATPLPTLASSAWRRWSPAIAVLAGLVGLGLVRQSIRLGAWTLDVPTRAGENRHDLAYPVGAADYLAESGFRGNLVTHFSAGAYVSWRLYPAVLVSMDSRYEAAYSPEAVTTSYELYAAAPGWERTLESYGADAVLVPESSPLGPLLAPTSPAGQSWREVYRDDGYRIFARPEVAAALPRVDRSGQTIVARFP